MFQLLYHSLGYIQLSVTGVNGTVNLPGRAVLCDPLAVSFSRIHPTVCNSNDGTVNLPGRAVLCVPVAVWFSRRIHPIVCNRS